MIKADQTTERLTGFAGVPAASALLRAGELVAFPTETVYGLGADATNPDAVVKVYDAKGRPRFNPLIVHLSSVDAALEIAAFPEWALQLAVAFWPGALTLVVPSRGILPEIVSAGRPSLALRVPSHPLALALLRASERPLAAPSANPSGRVSPTTACHVLDGLDGRIAAVLDGGPTEVGIESTIVGGEVPTLLRPGGIAVSEIEKVMGASLARSGLITKTVPSAPGQLASHYAPRVEVRLNAEEARGNEILLGFGDIAGDRTLSATGDLREAATHLFAALRELDTLGRPIAVAPIPETGLGLAINDRLTRAAAPR